MKKYLISLVVCLCCISCEWEVPLDNASGSGKIVVSAVMGGPGEQTVRLARSIPAGVSSDGLQNAEIDVAFFINGVPAELQRTDSFIPGLMGEVAYSVSGNMMPGDRISLKAMAEGYDDVYSEAVMPERPVVLGYEAAFVTVRDASVSGFARRINVKVDIEDEPSTKDYYGLQVYGISDNSEDDQEQEMSPLDFVGMEGRELEVPLPYIFGEDFYGAVIAAASDADAVDGKLRMDLNVSASSGKVKVMLWKLSEEVYRAIESDYRINSSGIVIMDAFRPGFATYSNVCGGAGFLGGAFMTESAWISPVETN